MIQQNISLKPYNTFGVAAKAHYFCEVASTAQLQALLTDKASKTLPKYLLGGGSNVLFTQDFDGLVIHNAIAGIEVIDQDQKNVWLKVGAGVCWHDLVLYCVNNDYQGVENLSLIPGSVGATPVQNIGAYGVELKDVFEELDAIDLNSTALKTFSHQDCRFGYRDSVFKNVFKGHYAITHVTLKLNKKPQFNVSYGALQKTLTEMQVENLSVKAISDAVIKIRQSKLPDPKVLANAGSFFKNPIITQARFDALGEQYGKIPNYPADKGHIKVAAAWLIEQCSWKGKRLGEVGVHEEHALILVNYSANSGEKIKNLADQIQATVEQKFSIPLDFEVNIV